MTPRLRTSSHMCAIRGEMLRRQSSPRMSLSYASDSAVGDLLTANSQLERSSNGCTARFLRHGVLLVFCVPCQLQALAGLEHVRTVPMLSKKSKIEGR